MLSLPGLVAAPAVATSSLMALTRVEDDISSLSLVGMRRQCTWMVIRRTMPSEAIC